MRAMDASILRELDSEGERRRLVRPMLLRRAQAAAEVSIGHTPSSLRLGHSFLTPLGIAADYHLPAARRPFLILKRDMLVEQRACIRAFSFPDEFQLVAAVRAPYEAAIQYYFGGSPMPYVQVLAPHDDSDE